MKEEDTKNTQIAVASNTQVLDLTAITVLANQVKTSPFAKDFTTTDKDGTKLVDTGAIIANMTLGYEMGLAPMASLMLGKRLNPNSYFSVLKGRELGIDPVTSISKIYNIPSGGGTVIALAVDIIIAKILQSGTKMEYIRDFQPTPTYTTITGEYVGHKHLISDKDGNIMPTFFLFIKDVTDMEDAKKAKKDGKIIIMQTGMTNVTSLRLVRESNKIDMIFHYSLQEATDAKLYNGYHSMLKDDKGNPFYVKGKDNWNNHPATHLRHRPASIGGRIVVADLLLGAYSIDEGIEILNVDSVQNEKDLVEHQYNNKPIDVEIIEENKEEV
jgi:hypothetical protein